MSDNELRGCTGLPDLPRDSRLGPDGRVYEGFFPAASEDCVCGCPFEIHVPGTYVSAAGWTIDGLKCERCQCLLNNGLEVEMAGGDCALFDTNPDEYHWSPDEPL